MSFGVRDFVASFLSGGLGFQEGLAPGFYMMGKWVSTRLDALQME